VSKGYIFEYLPNLTKKFRVLEVSFKDINEIKKKVEYILRIFKSKDPSKFKELPECYNFYCNDCDVCEEHASKI
ncbi:MAG TPA: hypothetical protein VJ438_00145, partial [Candidatus Nanoarchaeia archaeon]|nr:hypothetical protein [Candidatus Nanoarchaeia archaeon]